MTNKTIAKHLKLAADLLELTGGNPFRARAFGSAARKVDRLEESVSALLDAGTLTEVGGIGKGIAADIDTLLETGELPIVATILEALPPGLMDVLKVKGLGPKKVRTLWTELEVTSLESLEAAAVAGRIAALPGFGAKTQQNALDQIEQLRAYAGKVHYRTAAQLIEPFVRALRARTGIDRAEPSGAYRRQLAVIDQVHLVVVGTSASIRDGLAELGATETEGPADDRAFFHGMMPGGLPLTVHRTTTEAFGRVLWATTGAEAHVEQFVERFGLPGEASTEATVYQSVGLPVVPPALREGVDELDAAAQDRLPHLVTVADFKGTLHNHTTASDGTASLREMAEAARALGLTHLGIADHSRSLQVANGLSIERLEAQMEAIEALNAQYEADGIAFRVLSGSECDILADGSLDFPDDLLARLDLVVGSIHTSFGLGIEAQTERLIAAARNPHVDILGHPTGRLLLRREGYAVDHPAVIEACAETGTALELNAHPFRLDLDWRWVRRATHAGVPIAINPDAHGTHELENVQWGVAVAQKGWLTPDQCLNTWSLDRLLAWARHTD